MLDGVAIAVEPGERVALVGPTGAGKSTFAKLLTRKYDPVGGAIAFGEVDLRAASYASLRDRIVFVPQEGHLFSGSVADNVRLAQPEASGEDVREALGSIGALERFERLPDGLDTDVRSRGVRLSAGERQLVSLARVLLADPAVIVLDEATSSVDPGTERAVERALSVVAQGRTVITIAHRLSTAARADRVAVLSDGSSSSSARTRSSSRAAASTRSSGRAGCGAAPSPSSTRDEFAASAGVYTDMSTSTQTASTSSSWPFGPRWAGTPTGTRPPGSSRASSSGTCPRPDVLTAEQRVGDPRRLPEPRPPRRARRLVLDRRPRLAPRPGDGRSTTT